MTSFDIFILSIFDWLMIILIASKLVNIGRPKITKVITTVLIGSMLISLNSLLVNDYVLNHIWSSVINFILLGIFISKNRLKLNDYIIVFILTFAFLFIMQGTSVIIIRFIMKNFEYSLTYGLLSQTLATIIAVVINRYAPIQKLQVFLEYKNVVFKTLIINLYMVYFFITILWFIGIEHILNSAINMVVIIMLSLVINTVFLKASLINQANEERLKVFETYIPIINDVMEEFKSKQHDYHNHIQSLSVMKDNPVLFNNEVYKKYIEQVIAQEIWTYLIKLDNKILMAFFYSKYKYAKDNGIHVDFEISNYFMKSNYTDYQLVEIYGILIDNAIEASAPTDTKYIKISLKLKDNKNFFSIINSSRIITPVEVNKMFGRGYSTKANINRGLGLYKLGKMVEKDKGTITAYYDTKERKMVIELLHN